MKRPLVTAVFLCAIAGLAGCPIYDHESDGCYRDSDCALNYICNNRTGDCVVPSNFTCTRPSDCDSTATCTPAGVCMSGDCTFYNGCVAGYRCDSSSGVWGCVPNGSGTAGQAGQAGDSGEKTGPGGSAGQGGQSAASAGASDMSTGGLAGGG